MKLILIRHGKTSGNLEKKYIGRTDEQLCETAAAELRRFIYPKCEQLISSSKKRCLETCEIIYPGQSVDVVPEFDECDFGRFENKNYQMLADDPAYKKFLTDGYIDVFPEGEAVHAFKARCRQAFSAVIAESLDADVKSAAFVLHGGTIMAVLEAFGRPARSYYDWQIDNGAGYLGEIDEEMWQTGDFSIHITDKIGGRSL